MRARGRSGAPERHLTEEQKSYLRGKRYNREGGVSNVDIDGNNTLQVNVIGVTISTFETLPVVQATEDRPAPHSDGWGKSVSMCLQ